MSDSKTKLREATNKAAKSIADLVKLVELHGHAVSPEELRKMFGYLIHTVYSASVSARVAHDVSRATHGSFDFDLQLPVDLIEPVVQQIRPSRERFVRGADGTPSPAPTVPDVDGVDFIDED